MNHYFFLNPSPRSHLDHSSYAWINRYFSAYYSDRDGIWTRVYRSFLHNQCDTYIQDLPYIEDLP